MFGAGDESSGFFVPPSYQVGVDEGGVDVGGVNPGFFAWSPTSEFDSWLTVGTWDGTGTSDISTPGLDLSTWDADTSMFSSNGAVLLTNPSISNGGAIVVAQLTVASGIETVMVANLAGAHPRCAIMSTVFVLLPWILCLTFAWANKVPRNHEMSQSSSRTWSRTGGRMASFS
eukprot:SAG11_NODE_3193_length_2622_cov_1.318668_3_plen_173_part_00